MGFNVIINRDKQYKLSKQSIDSLTKEINNVVDLQREITDVSNFILNYMDKHTLSNNFKENVVDIIDGDAEVNNSLDNNDKTILYSISYLMELFKKEQKIFD